MALQSTTVWELRQNGNDNNGGGYVPGSSGTDYSQQASAQYALTGVTTAGADAILLTASAATDMVGNVLQIISGTNFTPGFYAVVSVVAGVSITLDRTCTTAAGSGGVVNLGGALATWDKVGNSSSPLIAGNVCFVKYSATPFTLTSAANMTRPSNVYFVGYDSNRSRYNFRETNRPLTTTATNSTSLFAGVGCNATFISLAFSNTAGTNAAFSTNLTTVSGGYFIGCVFDGFVNMTAGSTTSSNNWFYTCFACEFKNFTSYVFDLDASASSMALTDCYLHDSNGGILHTQSAGTINLIRCIFDTITNYGVRTTRTTTGQPAIQCVETVFYECAGGGIGMEGNAGILPSVFQLEDCIFWGGAYGVRRTNADTVIPTRSTYTGNAFGDQSTAARSGWLEGDNEIILTVDPFVDAANGDFTLNNTAGGGAELRALAYPVTIPGLVANYRDIGALQHEDTGGGPSAVEPFRAFIG